VEIPYFRIGRLVTQWWANKFTEASLDIWVHEDPANETPLLDLETIEAEVVFLVRQAGQWPLRQTEIHFHSSSPVHREIAATIVKTHRHNLASKGDDR
jgi:hypothetical protein